MMGQGEVKRGKHAKIRKMKEKYADQDEEERQMRMALTGSKHVEGFDINKHNKLKHGDVVTAGIDAAEEEKKEEEVEAVEEQAEEQQEAAQAEAPAEADLNGAA